MDERNLELEAWLIEAAGEEMMANHLGPNWNKFDEEFGFYPNMGMTVADLVWQHQQAKVEELQQENLRLAYGNTSYYNQAVKQNEIIETLQKRVDSTLQLLEKAKRLQSANYLIATLEQALKGE
ncbi:hypothetical protein [Acinetobacter baumannii]|uniref:hypothetical protein n=1 Tax=Acinetobacter baumannii TaxID=470 RepID=UPI000DE638CE|nr:hypothetical protein [Acinetobacter baumannii]SSS75975.1 Uncharacterised protein [Acinetobacter baumannii]